MLNEHDAAADTTVAGHETIPETNTQIGAQTSAATADPSAGAAPDTRAKKSAKKAATKKTRKKATATTETAETVENVDTPTDGPPDSAAATKSAKKVAKKSAAKKTAKKAATKGPKKSVAADAVPSATETDGPVADGSSEAGDRSGAALAMPLFKAPDPVAVTSRKKSEVAQPTDTEADGSEPADREADGGTSTHEAEEGAPSRKRRSRGGRNRRKAAADADQSGQDGGTAGSDPRDTKATRDNKSKTDTTATAGQPGQAQDAEKDAGAEAADGADNGSSHRRRRRRRGSEEAGEAAGTATKVRQPRAKKETITSVEGSTRIEAKKQRRREGREAGRRRPPILSESEFLARRESVERVMAIRQRGETTQIAVLEDNVLVEHYVALESQNSIIGNVYLGRVQNVLPSMEAAFIDIGKGRNAVLYAGEVNWDLRDDKNQPRRIENALKAGQSVLVQVSKDPVGHKGARLTSQISLPGRYLVYVPDGGTSGISRKLPDTERNRLKNLLKEILPEDAGVIIRTAAEGASEEELTRDVTRLTARWEDIDKKSKNGQAPQLLYAEPDTTLKVVRDLFTEDFTKLVIAGDDAWDMVDGYVQYVAPDLADRLERYEGEQDIFQSFRIDEQIAKALERKVWLPSGGSLVIDRTEAMTVVDVNTGKFTGSGGNLEETVTKNNLEAAEEIVRQLRLRDIGGIIVIDFIDMVLENNRDLVLRRLVECLGRDRTRHQVAEVTSLGLVQMTRKRISTGLLEAFSHPCEHCQGRGVIIEGEPVDPKRHEDHQHGSNGSRGSKRVSNRRRGGRRGGGDGDTPETTSANGDRTDASGPVTAASGPAPTPDTTPELVPAVDGTADSPPELSPEPSSRPRHERAADMAPVKSADDLPSAVTPRGRRRRRASRPTGAPSGSQ